MGKFINTTYTNSVDSIIDTMKDLINNPYYKWMDQKPTPVTYYHLNKDKSTLDPGSKLTWEEIGSNSSLVYDKIENLFIYGIEQISLSTSREEFGIMVDSIEGEGIILPNTIEPYPVDYFAIDYISEKILFKVNSSSYDTLDNGANVYKISYKAETSTEETFNKIENQVGDNYKMLIDNNGSGFKTIIRSEVYDFVEYLDNFLIRLKVYYKSLFYSTRVQAFIFKYLENRFYDPYLVEFIKTNDLLSGDGEYIHVCHQAGVDKKFPITYTYTIFHCLEHKDKANINRYKVQCNAKLIDQLNTTFHDRLEDYYMMDYSMKVPQIGGIIPTFPQEVIDNIRNGVLFEGELSIYNIIIKYLNDMELKQSDLDIFENIDYNDNVTLFYVIPCTIYCLERYIKDMLIDKEQANKTAK